MQINHFFHSLIIVSCLALSTAARADSPITSTPFSGAYTDLEIVQQAAAAGVINGDIAAYLAAPGNPVDVKAAVVNALSWKFEGKNNAELFTWYLALKYHTPLEKLNYEVLNPGELFSLGYMMVMDDYFNPGKAVPILEASAKADKTRSFTIAMILALTRAQTAMETDFCEVWQLTEDVLDDKSLKRDMKPEALDIILEYMNSYVDYCK